EPDLHRAVEAVYFGEHSHYPESIAAILWDNVEFERRSPEEITALRAELMRETVSRTAGDWDLKKLSNAVDVRLRERASAVAAFSNYCLLAVASDEQASEVVDVVSESNRTEERAS